MVAAARTQAAASRAGAVVGVRAVTAKRTVAARASPVEKAAAAVTVGAGSLIAATPALAEVETRMNGDGTGLILGVNSPILGSVLFVVFAGVWSLFSASAKDFGGQDEDDGLGLD